MQVTCPRCLRTLSTAEPDGPPVFCMYCGQKLRDGDTSPMPGEMRTTSFVPLGPETDDTATEPAPQEVGGYKLLRLIGSGGMGTVYEAEAATGNRVAVKLLSPRLASSPSSVERFKQEGRLASQLSHPRCVFVLAADTDAGRPYIVMELMPGRTLRDVVDREGPLAPERAIAYILDAIDGLAEAHRLGVLHRDMKPSNCFLTADDRVKVGDFGLSKSLTSSNDQHLTHTGTFLGTVLFASPEQIRGKPLDYAADVYSVCATLYYLLCGEAPYHHENVAAAFARAITEPPTPIREKRSGVPPALERVVMRGLERDRDRRWATLDDLRDALVDLLPGRQPPARPRMLIGAYLLDRIALAFLAVPAEVLRQGLAGEHHIRVDLFELQWITVLQLAYFTIGEGIFGATPGKWLLGLRVSKVGQTGPPGLWAGFVRTIVFHLLLAIVFIIPGLLAERGGRVGGLLGVAVFTVGLFSLALQLRHTPTGYRGLHDLVSGCHVTQRPLPARKLRLVSRHPNPVDTLQPAPEEPLPEMVGGYAVRGRVWVDDTAEQVWSAEDRALGRKVLLWLRPEQARPIPPEVSRPTRVRRLGGGQLCWNGTNFDWTAFSAPAGAPLADTIAPDRPLPWADARFLLEQLVDEFRAAEKDGSTPERLTLSQVWVEPNGRVQVLDFPMSGNEKYAVRSTQYTVHPHASSPSDVPSSHSAVSDHKSPGDPQSVRDTHKSPHSQQPAIKDHEQYDTQHSATNGHGSSNSQQSAINDLKPSDSRHSVLSTQYSLALLRQVASLTLEGKPRTDGRPVHAPVPPHAAPILQKLFRPDGYGSLDEIHQDLAETHHHTPEVTAAVRAAQLGIQAAVLSFGLVLMFAASGIMAVLLAGLAERRANQAEAALAALRDPAQRADLPSVPSGAESRLEDLRDRKTAEATARRNALLGPQRFALEKFDSGPEASKHVDPKAIHEALLWAGADPQSKLGRADSPWGQEAGPVWAVLVFVPLAWVVVAAVMRGGVSMLLTGIAVVRGDGRKAHRRQCALRTAAVWLPVVALLAGSVWVQVYHPDRPLVYVGLWLAAAVLLPVYVVIALRDPMRPPQDRIAGTYLVPV